MSKEKKEKDTVSKKDIKKIFDVQDKDYNFRNPDLKKYRERVKELYAKSDTFNRLNKSLEKGNIQVQDITDEKVKDRGKPYGKSGIQFNIEYNSRLNRFILVARNGKGELQAWKDFDTNDIKDSGELKKGSTVSEGIKSSLDKQQDELRERIKSRGFEDEYEKVYIPEDTEPKKTSDGRKGVIDSYSSYYRYGIFIYRTRKGRKYELIYQVSDVASRSVYVSYQRIIAQIKEDVLRTTGLSLEEWIYISKTRKDIYVEGGLRFKRFKNKRFTKSGKFTEKLDHDVHVRFDEL